MIITTTKIIHSTLLKILLIVLFSLIALVIALYHGISIENLDLPGLKIDRFYIKLDKKLIIEAKNVTIIGAQTNKKLKKSERKTRLLRQIDDVTRAIPYIHQIFQKVQIDRIVTPSSKLSFIYDDSIFYLQTDTLQIATRLDFDPKTKRLRADDLMLYIQGPDLLVQGKIDYDLKSRIWRSRGTYDGLNLKGAYRLRYVDDTLHFYLNSQPTDSIKPLIDYINPIKPIKVWIYPKTPAKKYVLHYLKGSIGLSFRGVRFDPEKISAYATGYDADIRFHPDVPPVHIRRVDVRYRHDDLSFKLFHPVYQGKDLTGSRVLIRNLVRRGAPHELDAHIVVHDRFDASIQKILKAYRIEVPFVQSKGKMDAVVDFTVSLSNGDILKFIGNFDVAKGQLLFDNTLPVDVEKLKVKAQDLQIDVIGGRAALNPWLEAWIKGHIDLAAGKGSFTADILKARFEAAGIPLIQTARQKLHVDLDFKNGVLFRFPQMDSSLQYRSGGQIDLKIARLGRWQAFFAPALKGLEDGRVDLNYQDARWKLKSALLWHNHIFLRSGKPIERFDVEAEGDKKSIDISLNRNTTLYHHDHMTKIRYSDLDLDLKSAIKRWKDIRQTARTAHQKSIQASKTAATSKSHIQIFGARSRIYYETISIPYDRMELRIASAPMEANLTAKVGSGTIHGIYRDGHIDAAGKNLPDRFIRGIAAFENLRGGYYGFTLKGTLNRFGGVVTVQDAIWGKSAVYNNVLATLDSIPSMLERQNPGFNTQGFKIKEGVITYLYDDPILHFKEIVIHGAVANIFGKGKIDFSKNRIDVRMRVQFLQSVSKTLKHIPVAGYILFGKDGTVSIGLDVKGSLDNPKVKTSAVKDIAIAPLNILKRTITLPFHLFE